jgi:hypothetical protein
MEKQVTGTPNFELHCHSKHSLSSSVLTEGICSPSEIVGHAKRIGLSGIAITDHDSIKGWKEAKIAAMKHKIIFIPGCEITTAAGHIVGLGINEFIRPGMGVEETIERIRSQGGIAIAPHPFDIKCEGVMDEFIKADAVEIFNALNSRMSDGIARRRARRTGMPFTGGSDAHTLEMIGNVRNIIDADNMDDIIRKIKKGRVTITGRPVQLGALVRWTRQRMTLSHEAALAYINENYFMFKAWMSKGLLEKFVNSDSNKWMILAWAGFFLTTYYAAGRVVYEELFLRLTRKYSDLY